MSSTLHKRSMKIANIDSTTSDHSMPKLFDPLPTVETPFDKLMSITSETSDTTEAWDDEDYEYEETDSRRSLTFSLLRYPLLICIILSMMLDLVLYFFFRFVVYVFESIYQLFLRNTHLKRNLVKSQSYDEWKHNAMVLDEALGYDKWKKLHSSEFDEHLVRKTTQRMMRLEDDIEKLMALMAKNACKNDLGGIEAEGLYSKCYYGTKDCIEQYVKQVLVSLDAVGNSDLSNEGKYAFFKHVSRMYGRTALCLSGGAQLSWFHLGVVKALFEQNLLPKIYTGTSAGSLIAASICVRNDDEVAELFDKTLADRINCCSETLVERMRNFLLTGAMFSDVDFREKALWFTKGHTTFLEAYKKTGRILNITVMSQEKHSKLKVLNYINTPDVTIVSATVASSAVPGVIPAPQLYMKDKEGKIVPFLSAGKLWRDGSMVSDIPERELQQLFRVKHTIVSQVNPHISMFFYKPRGGAGCPAFHRSGKGWRGGFVLSLLIRYFILDIHKWLNLIRDHELLPRILGANFSNLWLQSFEGNITILPDTPSISLLMRVLTDPNEEELAEFIKQGELKTWPKLLMVSNQVRIEQKIGEWLAATRQSGGFSASNLALS